MKNASFSYPLDVWVNEGGALGREAGSVVTQVRRSGSDGTSRWMCRFSPGVYRRTSARKLRRLRRNHCVLQNR